MEAFQKISDDPLQSCPQCGQDALNRGIGGGSVSFQFQGKGFYLTDYKKTGVSSCCPCGKDKKDCG
jgi:putative FmdB family regulatory protein